MKNSKDSKHTLEKILGLSEFHPTSTREDLEELLTLIFKLAEDQLERLAYKQDNYER